MHMFINQFAADDPIRALAGKNCFLRRNNCLLVRGGTFFLLNVRPGQEKTFFPRVNDSGTGGKMSHSLDAKDPVILERCVLVGSKGPD